MSHPYTNLNSYNYWYKAMSAPAPGHIDPVVNFRLISKKEKISTMGSCFAQHLSKNIEKSGFCYFVTEKSHADMNELDAKSKNYGVFSARYGNVYTARQALQLFERAFDGTYQFEHVWKKGNRFIDAFRPQIEPDGFETERDLLEDRNKHLESVRIVFLESDWLIFTLGLTEAWRSKSDGAIFPIAPGVSGGEFNPDIHEFINFNFDETLKDLSNLLFKIKKVNDKLKILLTVSPVPLIATYEKRHVLVSTVASKSILRAVSDEIERTFNNVIYFPSFEIITSPANSGRYFQDDLRQVTDIGVNHVMRIFAKHFMGDSLSDYKKDFDNSINENNLKSMNEIVCDEEVIVKAIKDSGF